MKIVAERWVHPVALETISCKRWLLPNNWHVRAATIMVKTRKPHVSLESTGNASIVRVTTFGTQSNQSTF